MISGTLRSVLVMLALATSVPAAAEPATEAPAEDAPKLAELLSRLATTGNESMRFEETRPSSLLADPVTVTGTLQREGELLVRETTAPRRETQTLSENHFEVRRANRSRNRFSLDRAPELAALRQALLALLDGNLAQLDEHFEHALDWDEQTWTLELIPRAPDMVERVHKLSLAGQDGRLKFMTVHLADGDQIETRFLTQASEDNPLLEREASTDQGNR